MIRVARATKPSILVRREDVWLQKLGSASTTTERKLAEGKYAHKDVRQALETMFHGKCAYCESKILHVDYGDIEHYRPKSGYPELTSDWDNLLLACGRCNGTQWKGDSFPDSDKGGPILNPCEDDPAAHLEFHYETREKLASVYGKRDRGETTKDLLGLNRVELRIHRGAQVTRLALVAALAVCDPVARGAA